MEHQVWNNLSNFKKADCSLIFLKTSVDKIYHYARLYVYTFNSRAYILVKLKFALVYSKVTKVECCIYFISITCSSQLANILLILILFYPLTAFSVIKIISELWTLIIFRYLWQRMTPSFSFLSLQRYQIAWFRSTNCLKFLHWERIPDTSCSHLWERCIACTIIMQ